MLLVVLLQVFDFSQDGPRRVLPPSQQEVDAVLDLFLVNNFVEVHHFHLEIIVFQALAVLDC